MQPPSPHVHLRKSPNTRAVSGRPPQSGRSQSRARAGPGAHPASMRAPATAGWNPLQLLDVDVHHVAGAIVLVAADHTPCWSIYELSRFSCWRTNTRCTVEAGMWRPWRSGRDRAWCAASAPRSGAPLAPGSDVGCAAAASSGRVARRRPPARTDATTCMPSLATRPSRPQRAPLGVLARSVEPESACQSGVSTALGWDTGEPPSGWISTTQTQPGGSLFVNNLYGHYT